jgi:hypothetical protein
MNAAKDLMRAAQADADVAHIKHASTSPRTTTRPFSIRVPGAWSELVNFADLRQAPGFATIQNTPK